jgi:hypothetical protein
MSSVPEQSPLSNGASDADESGEMSQETETFQSAVIGVFSTHSQAERIIKKLEDNGFPLRQLSIIGKGYHSEEHPVGFYSTGDRVKTWGGVGLFWGGLWGLLIGAAFFWVPAVGPIAAAGPIVHLLVSAVEGAAVVGGISAVGAALVSLGLPKKDVIKYESLIKAEKYIVIAHGDIHEVDKARHLMDQEQATDTAVVESAARSSPSPSDSGPAVPSGQSYRERGNLKQPDEDRA